MEKAAVGGFARNSLDTFAGHDGTTLLRSGGRSILVDPAAEFVPDQLYHQL